MGIAQLVLALAFIALLLPVTISPATADGSLDPANFDHSVPPAIDFYRFAAGGWLARHPIPPDRSSWGTFDEVEQTNELRLRTIFEAPAQTDARVGTEQRKIGDFYAACSDLDDIEANGIGALEPALRQIGALASRAQLATFLARQTLVPASSGVAPGFAFGSEQDPKDATSVIAALGQGGVSLPTRDYYLANDARSKALRHAYNTYLRRTFRLLGDGASAAASEADAVMTMETALARGSKEPADLRDPFANYHPMTATKLQAFAPHFDWGTYFTGVGLAHADGTRIDVGQPDFMRTFDRQVASAPLSEWKSYLRWYAIRAGDGALPRAYRDAAFAFTQALYGVPRQAPRWRTCTNATSDALGFAVGELFVAEYFQPPARARASREIGLIKAQLRADIESLPWMGPVTRRAALAKLAKLNTAKVGYPDHPRRYAKLPVTRPNYLADVLASSRFETERDVAKIGKPLDRSEWGFTPQTVNAYYDPSLNEIVVPAGILQPPFFDAKADDAVNFGAIGAVIGHELTHGFDDEGSNFDGNGNLRPWITPADAKRFRARVRCVVAQADSTVAIGSLHYNGKLVAGEATADIGGTTLAYRALQASLGHTQPAPIGGFTAAQRYYLAWAQVWRENDRPQAARAQVLEDPHPLAPYRVTATLQDDAPFYAAFSIKPGDPMYKPPGQRCQIW